MELRQAIEPWYVLGEEPAGGATARYVDSSVERLQVKVSGMTDERHVVSLQRPTRSASLDGDGQASLSREFAIAPGSRPSCLHPTIPVHTPLVFDVFDSWNGSVASAAALTTLLIPPAATTRPFRSTRTRPKPVVPPAFSLRVIHPDRCRRLTPSRTRFFR